MDGSNVKQAVQQLSGAVQKSDGGVFRGRPGQELATTTSCSREKPWNPLQNRLKTRLQNLPTQLLCTHLNPGNSAIGSVVSLLAQLTSRGFLYHLPC